jgi:hypothetical protein
MATLTRRVNHRGPIRPGRIVAGLASAGWGSLAGTAWGGFLDAAKEIAEGRRYGGSVSDGMPHAIHSPSCWRSSSVGSSPSLGIPVLVAAGPDAVVSSM